MKETIRHYLERLKQIITKPRMTKLMVIGLVSLCVGLVVSLGVLGFSYLSCRGERGIIPIDERLITHSEGVTYEDGKYLIPRAGGELTIVFPDTYVNKLEYRFRTHMTHVCKVYYEKKNQYGDYEIKEAFDDQKRYFERSVLPVQGTIRSLTFAFEEGNSSLRMWDFRIANTYHWNRYLFLSASCIAFALLFLFAYGRRHLRRRMPVLVFVMTFFMGMSILSYQPANPSGWDEQFHIAHAYLLAKTSDGTRGPQGLRIMYANTPDFMNCRPQTLEEFRDVVAFNQKYDKLLERVVFSRSSMTHMIGYIAPAIGITVGKILHLPFHQLLFVGRMMNLLLYALGMALACYLLPSGRRLLAVIALIPTALFTATTMSYDVHVIVFLTIAIAIWVREITALDRPFRMGWRAAFLACVLIGSAPKFVYAALALLLLFMPKEKYYSRRDMLITRIAFLVVGLAAVAYLGISTVLNASDGGDMRGGENVSEVGQLSYVLGHPLAYATLLIKEIFRTLFGSFFQIAPVHFNVHGGAAEPALYAIILSLATAFDRGSAAGYRGALRAKERIAGGLAVFASLSLMWTALYVRYTDAGKSVIDGVQARYYLPLMLLFFIVLRPGGEETRKSSRHTWMFFAAILLYLAYSVFTRFYLATCV